MERGDGITSCVRCGGLLQWRDNHVSCSRLCIDPAGWLPADTYREVAERRTRTLPDDIENHR